MYRIREVDGQDEEVVEMLTELHRLTFFDSAGFRNSIVVTGGLLSGKHSRLLSPV